MARNPELDHEYREDKKPVQPQNNPLLYGDISGGLQPRAGFQARMDPEMMAALKNDGTSRVQKLKYAAIAIALGLAGTLILYLLHTLGILSI